MNRVFFSLGPINLYWYSVCILVGVILAFIYIVNEGKKKDYSIEYFIDLSFYLLPIAIICARLYFVLFNFDYYSQNIIEILYIWEGGLAIHGGIIGGLLFLIYYTKTHKKNLLLFTDMIVPGLLIGQAVGRWGNFFNQEAHGHVTTISHLKNIFIPDFVIEGMKIEGSYYIPTFFYESVLCLIGLIIILLIKRNKNLKLGTITSIYLIWYGIIRFFIESYRTDSLFLGSIKTAQIVSILMVLIGIILLIYTILKQKNKYRGK